MIEKPLILTLTLDDASFGFFNDARKRYFPPDRNFIDAHLTLFHHLPGEEYEAIAKKLTQMCLVQEHVELAVTGVKMIGRGVAYVLESQQLVGFRQQLAHHWRHWLTPQDQQKLWPHITIQNKVAPQEAKALAEKLRQQFTPFAAAGTALQLWAYLGGPWKLMDTFHFSGDQAEQEPEERVTL